MIAIAAADRFRRTVVFGSGGVGGMAWEAGMVLGLFEAGLDLSDFDAVVGTSAGAVIGSHVAAELSPSLLYQRFSGLSGDLQEAFRPFSNREVDRKNRQLLEKLGGDVGEARRRVGRFSQRSTSATLAERHGIIAARLGGMEWPSKTLRLIATDTETGDGIAFDAGSGATLLTALAASCAVPGVWPPEPFGGRLYMDGGVRSSTNADFAATGRVLILSPLGWQLDNPMSGMLRLEVTALEAAGAKIAVIVPDAISTEAIGDNILDPARAPASAAAGRGQAPGVVNLFTRFEAADANAALPIAT